MDTVIVTSLAIKLGFAILAVVAASLILRQLDRSMGIKFSEHVWMVIANEPMALAVYFGARFLGVSVLVGLLIS